ncbi:hypothetical protein HDU96_003170 [Phlyctochytrium bullatum]|nr:hypothetical protein HDU96_003170 [Phlyctochytrium bullatum]
MVELKEVSALEEERDEDFVTEDEDAEDHAVDESDEEDIDISNETVWERLGALVDVIPYSKRRMAYLATQDFISKSLSAARATGKGLWVVATGALLVILPVALEIEREHFAMSQEAGQKAAQISGSGSGPALE